MFEGQKKIGFLVLEVVVFSKSSFVNQASLSTCFPLTPLEKITEQMRLHARSRGWAALGKE